MAGSKTASGSVGTSTPPGVLVTLKLSRITLSISWIGHVLAESGRREVSARVSDAQPLLARAHADLRNSDARWG